MHHLEAVVVKRWSYKAESPQSTHRHTFRNIQTEFMRNSNNGSKGVGMGVHDMVLPGFENPRICAAPRNLGQSEWDHKLRKIDCVFLLNEKMRWKWDDVYLHQGLWNRYSPSLCPPPLPVHFHTPAVTPYRCTLRLWWSELRDSLRGHDRANFEAIFAWVKRHTWMMWLSEFTDTHEAGNQEYSEIHLDPVIEWI